MGTGAAQLIPSPFCECGYCQKVRASGNRKNIRGRSGFQIDDYNLIDLGPDTSYTAGLFGVSFRKTRNNFYTHFHSDHFSFANWENLRMCSEPISMNVWLSEAAYNGLVKASNFLKTYPLQDVLKSCDFFQSHLSFHPVRVYETYQVDDLKVSPLWATHGGRFEGEIGINYLFERNGKRFLYACDTGLYRESNFEYLKGRKLNLLIIDCTFGNLPRPDTSPHLNCALLDQMMQRFIRDGVVTSDTEIYVTHIGHQCGMLHDEFEQKLQSLYGKKAFLAYDGLKIEDF
ncbi:MAG: hypothetical protein IJ713_07735 [Oscillibacter sp.]|nr:hypothetical protein [Oscillibacter sp.]